VFATAIKQLTHCVLVGLPQYFIHGEAAYAFFDEIRDQEVKFSLFVGGKRALDKVFS
jgi:hypothetical protein